MEKNTGRGRIKVTIESEINSMNQNAPDHEGVRCKDTLLFYD